MPNCWIKLLRSLDVFGQGINLTVERHATSQTILGGFLAIVLVFGLGTLCLINLRDVLIRKNPNVTNETIKNPSFQKISLDRNSFPLAFRLIDVKNNIVNRPEYFSFSVFRYDIARDGMVNLNVTDCTHEHFKSIDKDTFNQNEMDGTKCIDNQNITLEYIEFLSIGLTLCNNKTNSNQCAPLENIEKFLNANSVFFMLHWVDFSFNARNYENSKNSYINMIGKFIEFNQSQRSDFTVQKQELETDDGLLWASNRTESFLSIAKKEEFTHSPQGFFYKYQFFASDTVLKTIRIYERLQSAIASIGGLINVFKIACTVICYMFSTIQRDETILNQIFDYDINHSNLKRRKATIELKKTLDSILESRRVNQRSNMPSMHVLPSNISSGIGEQQNLCLEKNKSNVCNLDKVKVRPQVCSLRPRSLLRRGETCVDSKELISFSNLDATSPVVKKQEREVAKTIHELLYKKTIQQKLHFSFFQIIQAFLCPFKCCLNEKLKEKKDLFRKSRDAIGEFTDIIFIIHKMEEIERLKFILLNNDQLCLFNFITKNLCTMNPEKERAHQIEKFKNMTREKIPRIAELILADTRRSRFFGNNISEDINSRLNMILIEELKNVF